ncbi:hypothetical protein ILYODFUR_026484, partial [Ilyodon furcidens]
MEHVSGCRWGRGGVTAAEGRWIQAGQVRRDHGGAASGCGGQTGQSSSVLLGIQLPLAAAHSSDESSSLTTAVLRQQEVDFALR